MLPSDIPESLAAAVGLTELDRRAEDLARIADESDRLRFAMAWPDLLAPAVRSLLREDLARADRMTGDLRDAFDFLDKVAHDFHEHRVHYEPGSGPIARVWAAQVSGAISEDDTATILRSASMAAVLYEDYVFAVCGWLLTTVTEEEDFVGVEDVIHRAQIARLLAEATDALSASPEATSSRRMAHLTWVRLTGPALLRLPDARIYRRVTEAGERLVAEAVEQGDSEFVGHMLHELALIHFPAYIANRSSTTYKRAIAEWREGLPDILGSAASLVARDEWLMPPPREALAKTARLFRAARDHREGVALRSTELCLFETLGFQSFLGEPGTEGEMLELGERLLDATDRESDAAQWAKLLAHMQHHGRPIGEDELDQIRGASLDQRLKSLATPAALDFVVQAAGALASIDPRHALNLLRAARELLHDASESARLAHWNLELTLLLRVYDDSDLDAAAIRAAGSAEGWDVERVALGLLRIAVTTNERDEALRLLDEIETLAPTLAGTYRSPLALFRARVLYQHPRDGAVGIDDCIVAAEALLDLDVPGEALAALERVRGLAQGPAEAVPSAVRLPACSFLLEQKLGSRATPVLQTACSEAIAGQGEHLTVDNFLAAAQAAKGLRFASVLDGGLEEGWMSDPARVHLLNRVHEAEAAVKATTEAAASPTGISRVLGRALPDETLLVAYAGRLNATSASTKEGRLAAAQQAFDARVTALTLKSVGAAPPYVLTLEDIQRGLDDQTVLLIIYIAEVVAGHGDIEPWLYVLFVTRDDVLTVGRRETGVPARLVLRSGDRVLGEVSIHAISVQRCRANVQRDPGPWPISPDDPNSMDLDLFFPEAIIDRLLDERRRGRDHLCIVPHGPAHFHPFHLCGPREAPLADEWTVTYLPNLHLLTPHDGVRRPRRHRPTRLAAIGLGFEHSRRGLAPIPDAVAEAHEIASVFGTEAITNTKATKDHVIAALESSRFVHISTHGEHAVAAPAFQCVYVAGGPDDDDRLLAHELLALDLRGLEVLSLSACESGLGRVDTADNLQGVPANALLAGVETLVVTLWPVTADCSRLFFTLLYARLRDRATRRQAFAAAQEKTRDVYPHYRDWGAFALIGDWT
jgi:CHAT domain-containing protein